MKKLIFCTAFSSLLAACASPPPAAVAPAAGTPQAVRAPSPMPATQAAIPAKLPPYKDPLNILYKERSVYFDFDSFIVKADYGHAITAHSQFLHATPALAIRIEGNSDERGSSEYNLALGQKRAEAVKKMMLLQGVRESQVEAVSFGKEKPKASGHDESAWQQNRRADIVYP